MKKNILILTAIFLTCFSTLNAQWINYSFSTNLDVLQDIHFIDANTGFIAGYQNGSSNTFNRIYRTTNGGTTWTQVLEIIDPLPPTTISHSLHSFYFTSPSVGFCVGGRNGLYPFICKTTDGGITWDTLSLPFTSFVVNVFFPSSNVGYICGEPPVAQTALFKTIDGGANWTDISAAASASMNGTPISDIHFLDDLNGFASTLPSSNVQAGIYKTTNGGISWTQVFTIGNNEGFKALHFINATTGFAAATIGKVFKTIDGGTTWTPIPILSIGTDVLDVYFISSQLGYAASSDGSFSGAIYKTINGGSSWTLDNSGNFVSFRDAYSCKNHISVTRICNCVTRTQDKNVYS